MNRRKFLELSAGAGSALALGHGAPAPARAQSRTRVVVVNEDHGDGVTRALRLLAADGLSRRHVVVKPNFKSADPFPGSTHPDTLGALVEWLGAAGASRVTVADRSGMGVTREVMEARASRPRGRSSASRRSCSTSCPPGTGSPTRSAAATGAAACSFPACSRRRTLSSPPARSRPTASGATSPCRSRTAWAPWPSTAPTATTTWASSMAPRRSGR